MNIQGRTIQREASEQWVMRWVEETGQDLTGDPVAVAFVDPAARPSSGDWRDCTWAPHGTEVGVDKAYTPMTGSTPADIILAPGRYRVFGKIEDNPQVIIEDFGIITVA